jgi:hypothetical protein
VWRTRTRNAHSAEVAHPVSETSVAVQIRPKTISVWRAPHVKQDTVSPTGVQQSIHLFPTAQSVRVQLVILVRSISMISATNSFYVFNFDDFYYHFSYSISMILTLNYVLGSRKLRAGL